MPGTASVPGIAGWTCDVSVVATCADASSVGISSTTLTTSASATSSATSCDGARLNDSSRVLEDAVSDDAAGAVTGAVLAARAFSGVVDGALVVSGVGEPVSFLSWIARGGLVGFGVASAKLLGGASIFCVWVCAPGPCGWVWKGGFVLAVSPLPDPL